MNNLFSVKNKLVLITGSSRGLGYAFARGFLDAGARVVLNGRDPERLVKAAKELGNSVRAYAFDVSDEKQVVESMARMEKEAGPLDVLVNNAGIHRRALLEEMTAEEFKAVLDTDLFSAFLISREAVRGMKDRGAGVIINITSLNAVGARPSIGNYCAAKAGLAMLTKSMAGEWGKHGIRVNAIGPGYFSTDMTEKLRKDPEFDSWVREEVPLGRWGRPEELVGTALFLSSEAASYIHGQTIYVDGGWQATL